MRTRLLKILHEFVARKRLETRWNTATVIERIRRRSRKVELPQRWIDSTRLLRKDRSR